MKFKVGDIIRLSDEKDIHYIDNAMWRVEPPDEKGRYSLYSFRRESMVDMSNLEEGLIASSYGQTVNEFIENNYRVVTDTELVLYGRKNIQS